MAGKQFFKGQPAGEAQVAHGLNLAENPVAVERAQQLFQTPPGKVAVIVAEHGRHVVRQLNGNFNWHHWNLTGAEKIATHVANKFSSTSTSVAASGAAHKMKTAQYVGLTLTPAIDSGGGFVFNAEAQRRQGAEGDGGVCIRLLPPRIACWSHRLSHRGGDGSSPGEELSPSWRSGGLQPAWRVRFRKTVEKATVGDGRELIGRSQTGALRAVRGEVKDGLGSSPRPSPRLARRGGKARGGRRIGGIDYARQLTGWFGISWVMARQMRSEFAGAVYPLPLLKLRRDKGDEIGRLAAVSGHAGTGVSHRLRAGIGAY